MSTSISLISELAAAIREQNAAPIVIADAKCQRAIIEASLTLTIEGKNEPERKARLVLALRNHPGYQALCATVREARASMFSAERRTAITRARIALLRHALSLLVPGLRHE